ncbi:hypothetical protein DFH11DRAFT_1515373 [Phellopilus nigrolimitatus]|nr:hypothetical protein DFH11DRAFT_1515373 [Phellopilus nigrolimitatus]
MAPSTKAKAAGVSASSFLDLKAELAKKETEFSKKKGAYATGGALPGDKVPILHPPTIWARTNKGVAARNARDLEEDQVSRRTVESARTALERKALIYDKLRKGKTGGLSDAQYDALLVDFDAKALDDHYSSDSEDVDESLMVPKPVDDSDDPLVEYEDEFGRMRTAKKSEVPRDLMPSAQDEEPVDDDPYVVRSYISTLLLRMLFSNIHVVNPVNHFPVYEPSAERIAAIDEAASEAANPLATHYDATREVRAKGAGFYAFSADEEARAREMEELRLAREETERVRQETGAVNVRPGEIEGMGNEPQDADANAEGGRKAKGKEAVLAARSRAMEKRKRELEERKKLVEAKRRKVKAPEGEGDGRAEAETPKATASAADPFAALEVKAQGTIGASGEKGKSRWDQTKKAPKAGPSTATSADDFLAQLEMDLVGKK